MRLNIAVPEQHVAKPVLDAALESVTRLNEQLLAEKAVPTFQRIMEESGGQAVRWKPEPPGGEHFDHAALVAQRGWGDCDDLAPWHAASLRATGEDKGATAIVKKSGPKRWHAVVKRSDGRIEDPSLLAGMRGEAAAKGWRGPMVPAMAKLSGSSVSGDRLAMPQLAVRPRFDESGEVVGFDARVDIPWHHSPSDFNEDVAMAALRRAPVASQAVVGALRGGLRIAEVSGLVHPDVLDRAEAIADYIDGYEWEDLAEEYDEEHADAVVSVVGDFFDAIADVASKAVQFIPAVGPIISTGVDIAHDVVNDIRKPKPGAKKSKGKGRIVHAKKRKLVVPKSAARSRRELEMNERGAVYRIFP